MAGEQVSGGWRATLVRDMRKLNAGEHVEHLARQMVRAADPDITEAELERHNARGILGAIDLSYAYIEFDLKGQVLKANPNFLNLMGYREDEVTGRHHRMFVETGAAQSNEYQEFWKSLNRGEFVAQEFKRVGKGGKVVWIQASYNPILDSANKPTKVIKFAGIKAE